MHQRVRQHLRHAFLSFLLGILQNASVAQAGNGADEAIPVAPPQQVEVKGQYNARRQDTASKSVISHAEITRYGDTTLLEVLKRLPAITVIGNEVRMRGLGSGYTQILLNGQKAPAGFSIETLAPDAIEKIEIIRSASADLSTQAIAGSINIITRNVVRSEQTELKSSVGNEGGALSPFLNLQRSGRDGDMSHTLVLSIAQSRFSNPSTSQQQYADSYGVPTTSISNNQQATGDSFSIYFNPRLNWKLANGDTIASQSLVRYTRNSGAMQETNLTVFGQAPPYPDSSNQTQSNGGIVNSNISWTHHLSDDSIFDTKLGFSYVVRNSEQQFLGQNTITRLARQSSNYSRDGELSFSGKNATNLIAQHTMVFGWDGATQQRHEQREQTDLYKEHDSESVGSFLDQDFSVQVNRLALFAQDEWNLTQHWSAYLGMRWEAVRTHSVGTSIISSNNRSSVLSPILQALWKLPDHESSQLRIALARTYKAPTVGNLTARRVLAIDNKPNTPDYQGNPGLRPELAWGLDVALEYFTADGGTFSVSSYLRQISDFTGHSLQQINQRWVAMPSNEGQANSHGIELEAKFNVQSIVADAPAIDMRANLSRNWSAVKSVPGPGNRLDGQTPLSLNLGMDYVSPNSNLTVGGNFGFQTGGIVRSSSSEMSFSGVLRNLDVYALWRYDKRSQLRLTLSNLLHQPILTNTRFENVQGSITRSVRSSNSSSVRLTFEHKFM